MLRRVCLARDFAGLVHDRHRTGAGVLDDRTGDDVDDRRPLGVAMPGDDSTRLNDELAEAEFVVLQVRRLLGEIDRGDQLVGYVLVSRWSRLLAVDRDIVGRAFTGACRSRE